MLGDPATAEALRRKLESGPLINATVVGYIPLDGDRRYEDCSPRRPPARRRCWAA